MEKDFDKKAYREYCKENPIVEGRNGLFGYDRYLDGIDMRYLIYATRQTAGKARKQAFKEWYMEDKRREKDCEEQEQFRQAEIKELKDRISVAKANGTSEDDVCELEYALLEVSR